VACRSTPYSLSTLHLGELGDHRERKISGDRDARNPTFAGRGGCKFRVVVARWLRSVCVMAARGFLVAASRVIASSI
jgi:hypothetical protein